MHCTSNFGLLVFQHDGHGRNWREISTRTQSICPMKPGSPRNASKQHTAPHTMQHGLTGVFMLYQHDQDGPQQLSAHFD